jgi:hypothetical protein
MAALLRPLLAFAALVVAAEPAFAQSLRELRSREAEEGRLAREAAYTSSVCGSAIDARIDWRSAGGWPEGESLAEACGGALSALEAVCRSGKGKGRVSRFVCAGDGSGPRLSGGTLRYGASPSSSGFSETRSYLDNLF